MALRGYFYRNWYPGMNDENGVVNLDKVYKCSRRLGRAKKWTIRLLLLCFLILLVSLLIYNFVPNSDRDHSEHKHKTGDEQRCQRHSIRFKSNGDGDDLHLDVPSYAAASNSTVPLNSPFASNSPVALNSTVPLNSPFASNSPVASNSTVASNSNVAPNSTVASNSNGAPNSTVASNSNGASNSTVASNSNGASNSTVASNSDVASNSNVASNSTVYGKVCPLGHFKCRSTGNCFPISAYCDGVPDCGEDDFSDEPIGKNGCSCRHYLKLRSPERICDGAITCTDRSDELGCPCREDSFRCNGSNSEECVLPEMVCDGEQDCSTGVDEANCISLSRSSVRFDNVSSENMEGYALIRRRGVWHPYCSNDWSKEMGIKICQKLGFAQLDNLQTVDLMDYNLRKQMEEQVASRKQSSNEVELIVADELNDSKKTATDFAEASKKENLQWTSCKMGYVRCQKKLIT